mmetsp:Transcript_2395/g.3480  ORF Transcript_2395/g.3480 Transcript_2395/m.3480 type:complete len:212 (-) Transcript_2395:42-677(-)
MVSSKIDLQDLQAVTHSIETNFHISGKDVKKDVRDREILKEVIHHANKSFFMASAAGLFMGRIVLGRKHFQRWVPIGQQIASDVLLKFRPYKGFSPIVSLVGFITTFYATKATLSNAFMQEWIPRALNNDTPLGEKLRRNLFNDNELLFDKYVQDQYKTKESRVKLLLGNDLEEYESYMKFKDQQEGGRRKVKVYESRYDEANDREYWERL